MKRLAIAIALSLATAVIGACSKSGAPTAPTPVSPPVMVAPAVPILTIEPDTATPVGQSVAITLASRSQDAGKIAVAVTGYNLRNELSTTSNGLNGASGRLKWDGALLEFDGAGPGDLLGGTAGATCCGNQSASSGLFVFSVARTDRTRVMGSGELFLLRLRPRAGIVQGATRIELEPFTANEGGAITFTTFVLLSPYSPVLGNVIERVYGATISIQPGS